MKGLREKFRNKKGFTLVEMLIVVAIVAILVAISIPLVNSALEKARHATDDANFRSAAALGTIKYLTEEGATGTYYYYTNNASQGGLYLNTKAATDADAGNAPCEAKCTCATNGSTSGSTKTAKYLQVKIADDGKVEVEWTATAAPAGTT